MLGLPPAEAHALIRRTVEACDGHVGNAAELLGVSRLTVSQVLHGHRALSPDMAMRLEKLLGTSAESWLRMQEAVDLWEARQQPERFATIKRLPASAAA